MLVPVLIVGGGPVGLAASVALARLGVASCLVERHPRTTFHPKARNLNLRSAEILRSWDVWDELEKGSLPEHWTRQFVYTRTLSGEELGRMRTGSFAGTVAELTPARPLLSSQDRIEPVLRARAEREANTELRFGCELVGFEIERDGVCAELREGSTSRKLRARYLLAADGAASSVRERLGIDLEGPQGLGAFINVYFRADLSRFTDERPAVLYWISEPGHTGVLQPLDGIDRWLCQIAYDAGAESIEDHPPERCRAWLRGAVGDPSFEPEILSVGSWTMNAAVASTMRRGPVFLLGDAAHQLPPTGGFGMNTGLQDAHNLAWKLAGVLAGWGRPELLDSYDLERRPIARYNAERSLENARMVGRVNAAAQRGEGAGAAVADSRRYGNFLGMDLGFAYEQGVLIDDGTAPPSVADPVIEYQPCARPGHRAPHLSLRKHGRALSTLDLFDGRFTLLVAGDADDWRSAAAARRGGLPLAVFGVGDGHDLEDPAARFPGAYGLEAGGAVLVRPDGHVAWRAATPVADPAATLAATLDALALGPA